MSETATVVSGVAERYASALFELADESRQLSTVAEDIARFETLLGASADLRRLIRSPVFTPDDQLAAVAAILARAKIDGLVANFVKLAARNRRLFVLPDMFKTYRALLAANRGEAGAEVASAEPLTPTQLSDLKLALASVTGKSVQINARVDPSLIGGLVVRLGSRMIDSSLKTKLNALKIALKEVG